MSAYAIVLVAHSILRWVVLIAGLAAVVQGLIGLFSGGDFERRHRLSNLGYLISMDTMLLLGLVLYGVLSPTTQAAFADMGAAMKNGVLRFWAVEHLVGMLLATIVVHVAYVFVKRASRDRGKHLWTAAGMGVSLLMVLASIPWPFREAGRGLLPGL